MFALLAAAGLVVAVIGIVGQVRPRVFTAAQRHEIEAWEIAKRWRTIQKDRIFPAVIRYKLAGQAIESPGALGLTARRLAIGRQATCASVAGAKSALPLLRQDHCQAMLRATYTDGTGSYVVTVGVAVLPDQASARTAAQSLTGRPDAGNGAVARAVLLRPLPVAGTPAARFGVRQRQLSWVESAGSYLVVATAGYSDGRPYVQVRTDSYVLLEMTSLAEGVAGEVAVPLGTPPPPPTCPATGAPPC